MKKIKKDFLSIILLVGIIIVWGINFPIMKFAFLKISPMAFNVLRFSFSSFALLLILLIREGWQKISKKDWILLSAQGFFHTFFYQIFFINGLFKTSSGIASILTSTSPLWTAFLARVFKIEKLNKWIISGIFITFLGVILIVSGNKNGLNYGEEFIGELFLLISAVSWASGTIVSKKLLEKYSPLRITTLSMVIGSFGLIIAGCSNIIKQDWILIDLITWSAIAFSAIFSILLGYLIWALAIKEIGATKTAAFGNLTPVIAFIAAYLINKETVAYQQILGSIIIMIGIALCDFYRKDFGFWRKE